MISEKTVSRLVVYRRLLNGLLAEKVHSIHSQALADMAKVTAAQVRRDLMGVGYTGTPTLGYDVAKLLQSMRDYLDTSDPQGVALVGVGHLGSAILSYFAGRRPKLVIKAAFDIDPQKTHRSFRGCACYPVKELQNVARKQGIKVAIIAVPAGAAQQIADQLTSAGVKGIVNFAPAPLRVPDNVYVENVDITTALEKVAFFALHGDKQRGGKTKSRRTS